MLETAIHGEEQQLSLNWNNKEKQVKTKKSRNVVPLEMNNKNVEVLFLWKGTTKCESVVPSKRNIKKAEMLFFRKGTIKCENVVPLERNRKKQKMQKCKNLYRK